MAFGLTAAVIQIVVTTIILGPVLWLAGRTLVGKEKAKFTDGLWIAALGTIIGLVLGYFLPSIIAFIVVLIVWLALIRKFFDCGWGKAILIGIVAIVILIVVSVILGLLGFLALTALLPGLP